MRTLLSWADEFARIEVMTNVDTPEAAARAVEFGAMGIGLCRTERMFNAPERLPVVVDMILADTPEEREKALEGLLPMQRADFKELFTVMSPRPVTIRLLDPPIHEFLPTERQLETQLANLRQLQASAEALQDLLGGQADSGAPSSPLLDVQTINDAIARKELMLLKVRELFEVNPMLGHRGVRLGLTHPEIYAMQIRAVLEAAAECIRDGIEVNPEIMVPQVCTAQELVRVRSQVDRIKQEVEQSKGVEVDLEFGTMIEVVRACMRAGKLAEYAEFFSFGTNDLTQATFSFSREDAENKFLPMYNENDILQDNPFEVLDVKGLGQLILLCQC